MRHDYLIQQKCWFGGGTAIVLKLGEYRRSLNVDFLCADIDGYRELRSAAVKHGAAAFFDGPIEQLREFKADQYGIRAMLSFRGQPIKFEVIRESRIEIEGTFDPQLGVPTLVAEDMYAERLLANADRCFDLSVAYRDAVDLGMLIAELGSIPEASIHKAEKAYGEDVAAKLIAIIAALVDDTEKIRHAAGALDMQEGEVLRSIEALRADCLRLWPGSVR
ncbi:nucleotidyl transferase AbiEii/AbiGii toxin family protein [Lacibacterium aquatile]|uniref:Nucleotidyl transferase AbiEii/AbiGii toxin family protein n=1 Tax=Lacibacterium aquatile TaxID=1168082 RepID=A0ABW5DPA1_9PROT